MIQKKTTFVLGLILMSSIAAQASNFSLLREQFKSNLVGAANSPANTEVYAARVKDFQTLTTNAKIDDRERLMLMNVLITRSKKSIKEQTASLPVGGDTLAEWLSTDLTRVADAVKNKRFSEANSLVQNHWTSWIKQ